jgi:hypothetical protein
MMNAKVEIQSHIITRDGFALVNILNDDGTRLCQMDIEYSKLASLGQTNEIAIDFLLLAASVYNLDKLVLRNNAPDCWHRKFAVQLPVSNVRMWGSVKNDLDQCISFLTGDSWDVNFIAQEASLNHFNKTVILPQAGNAAALFSGGLDSLVGAIDWLESNNGHHLCLVGHHDGRIAGTYGDQNNLLEILKTEYSGRITDILVRIGHNSESTKERESSLRARSLLFAALGIFVASILGPNTPLFIPENGTIALNIPLTPSRRGSCSTRTAHPYYLYMLSRIFTKLGLTNPFINPLGLKTKGEAVQQCLNQKILKDTSEISVSCAKRGHPVHRTYTGSEAKSCGRCMPCIYRRAALHTVGLDNERYGDDICRGEVDISKTEAKSNDLRACFNFLRWNPSIDEISTMLIANGSLDVGQLPSYAAMVQRTMNEIRTLLHDKATRQIKRFAGVS